jgi:hypothetical protein
LHYHPNPPCPFQEVVECVFPIGLAINELVFYEHYVRGAFALAVINHCHAGYIEPRGFPPHVNDELIFGALFLPEDKSSFWEPAFPPVIAIPIRCMEGKRDYKASRQRGKNKVIVRNRAGISVAFQQ